jgi:hypothetical protein
MRRANQQKKYQPVIQSASWKRLFAQCLVGSLTHKVRRASNESTKVLSLIRGHRHGIATARVKSG